VAFTAPSLLLILDGHKHFKYIQKKLASALPDQAGVENVHVVSTKVTHQPASQWPLEFV
jgi:hypothetical protein